MRWPGVCPAPAAAGRGAASAESQRERANQGVITVLAGGVSGTYIRIASDMASVLDDGERLRILNTQSGAFRCRTVFNCTDACPRGIQVTKAIEEVKRAILTEHVR